MSQRTFAIIITYGIRWYGDDSSVQRVFFAKRNPDNHNDSSANFYYRHEVSADSVKRILRLIEDNKCPVLHAPIISGARDVNSGDSFSRYPTVDVSYDVSHIAPVEPVESFPVASLSREDLESRGFDTSNVSDLLMYKLADRLGDSFVGYGEYWEALDYAAEHYDIPRNPNWNEDSDDEDYE